MKIAIASSGLGHVARGIETWALDTAVALSQWAVDSRPLAVEPGQSKEADIEVALFCAAPLSLPTAHCPLPTSSPSPLPTVHCPLLTIRVLPSLKRGDRLAKSLTRIFPKWAWRWGLKSTYDLEQWSFWWRLWPELRRGKFDIVHVQDPWLALLLERSGRWGWHPAKVILAHGTEESLEFLEKFEYVQHLAPWHLEQALKNLEEKRI